MTGSRSRPRRLTLNHLFALSLQRRASEPALEIGRVYTFAEIDAMAGQIARELYARNIRAGDRLCFYLPNSLQFIAVYLAALRLGAVVVPMNILYRDRELRHILSDAEPRAVIASEEDAERISHVAPIWLAEELIGAAERQVATPRDGVADGAAPALIVYTSGTTGAPKGAVLTHSMLASNAMTLVTCWHITSGDRFLLTLPLFHVHGLCVGLHSWLIAGCLLRLEPRFDRHAIQDQMARFAPTLFFGVPTMYVRMLEMDEDSARVVGRKMRLFVSGSAPLSARVWAAFRDRFNHAILERYGMSETLINTANPYAGERRPGSVGPALPGVDVRVFDEHGRPVQDETAGELCVRGPNVFREYWRRPEATTQAFRGEWFRTGDIGARSADGYFMLHGRRSDLIISGGFNIYPREIEDFLHEQRGVAEAAVAGVEDPVRGEMPVAFIVPAEGWDATRIERACREQLASFKVPRRFVVLERLPRTSLGKVQKQKLVALAKEP